MAISKTYLLEGLCCENCAAAIERETRSLAGVKSADVDYPNASITVVFDADESAIFESVSAIAAEIDEDIATKAL
ncbi:MAG: heavy-metal-associated domain-containing protein [Clostridiales bacterium]|jgi:Cd2+/Zn2+-exporting ATPase|nr:heavy-metal-associated domain-containing protein [Clostridiales bacterium]